MKYPSLAKKANNLTYGLLYPAFFGNMIYDLILQYFEPHHFRGVKFWNGLLIVFYYALDYIHLYGDLDESVGKNVENKSWLYIGCDALSSMLFFVSFVFLKYDFLNSSIFAIGLVPFVILGYKTKHRIHKTDLRWIYAFAAISLVGIPLCIVVVTGEAKSLAYLIFLVVELLYYGVYVLYYYGPALAKQIDLNNASGAAAVAKMAAATEGEENLDRNKNEGAL